MDEALHILQTPRLWPDWPYLRVERRTELRPDAPICVLVADELQQVVPTVYFTDNFPPGEWFVPTEERALAYTSLEEVRANGWKPHYPLQQASSPPL